MNKNFVVSFFQKKIEIPQFSLRSLQDRVWPQTIRFHFMRMLHTFYRSTVWAQTTHCYISQSMFLQVQIRQILKLHRNY